jgi:electron transfer flavoprotein alpha subunit
MRCAVVAFNWIPHCSDQLRILLAAARSAGCDSSKSEAWILGMDSEIEDDYKVLPCSSVFLGGNLNTISTPEEILETLNWFCGESPVDIIFFFDGISGGEVASRLAYRLGSTYRRGIVAIERKGSNLLLSCGIYQQNLMADYLVSPEKLILGIAAATWDDFDYSGQPVIKKMDFVSRKQNLFIEDLTCEKPQEYMNLGDAKRLVVGGQGVGSKAAFAEIVAFAKLVGAEYGCSRPVAANGWAGYDRVIGMSGVSTKAEMALICGVSGSSAFQVGIRESRFTIGVNIDPKAPIFNVCDIGVVGDYKKVLEGLTEYIKTKGR